jgi:hypothetical protein
LDEEDPLRLVLSQFEPNGEITLFWSDTIKDPNDYSFEVNGTMTNVSAEYLNSDKYEYFSVSYESNKLNKTENLPEMVDWDIIEVDYQKVVIKVNFTNPLYVSSDEWDEV